MGNNKYIIRSTGKYYTWTGKKMNKFRTLGELDVVDCDYQNIVEYNTTVKIETLQFILSLTTILKFISILCII